MVVLVIRTLHNILDFSLSTCRDARPCCVVEVRNGHVTCPVNCDYIFLLGRGDKNHLKAEALEMQGRKNSPALSLGLWLGLRN